MRKRLINLICGTPTAGCRRAARPCVVGVCVALALPVAGFAGPIIQDFSNEARNIAPFAGQTFTAEDSFIDVVGVYVVDFTLGSVATDTTIDYRLYEGAYDGVVGTLLGSRTFSGLSEGFSGYADVSFAGIPLTVGGVYTILVTNDTFEWGVGSAFAAGGTYYTGGTALLPPDYGAGLPPRDLRFRVLPAAPEPGALALLAAGVAGVVAGRRRNGRQA